MFSTYIKSSLHSDFSCIDDSKIVNHFNLNFWLLNSDIKIIERWLNLF